MIVKCNKAFRHQTSEGRMYKVIEVMIKKNSNAVSYRIIDNEGIPSIYDASDFSVIVNDMRDAAILIDDFQIVMSHRHIINSELNKKHTEGFWGAYFDDDYEAKRILQEVLEEQDTEYNAHHEQ